MNLKLNNDMKSPIKLEKSSDSIVQDKKTSKQLQQEERRRIGRYVAILAGLSLFIIAIYHAWVRKIPVVASLVVPGLIMFVYVAWVLYTAARDKRKCLLFDLEAGSGASPEPESGSLQVAEVMQNNVEIFVVPTEAESNSNSPVEHIGLELCSSLYKEKNSSSANNFILPIILVNDQPTDDLDQKWLNLIDLPKNEKFKSLYKRRRFKRRFCRSRRNAVFKRSYSIG